MSTMPAAYRKIITPLIDEASALPMEQRLALVDALLRTLDRPTPASPGESALPSRPAAPPRAVEPEPDTLCVLRAFRKRMAQRYGGRLRGVVLFGSRVRGIPALEVPSGKRAKPGEWRRREAE